MMAMAFAGGAITLQWELKRKEKEGLLHPLSERVLEYQPIGYMEIAIQAVWGFVIGFKLLFIALNYSSCTENPQQALFSLKGNALGGLLLAALAAFLKFREKQKVGDKQPELKTVLVYPHQEVWNMTMVVALFGLLGAKVFDYLESPHDFDNILQDPASVLFSGLTMYGGLIFGALAGAWYVHRKKIPLVFAFDAAAPGLMLGYAIGRVGCHIAGDGDWGIDNLASKPSWMGFLPDWVWSFQYAHNVNNAGIAIPGCIGKHCYMLENPVFPTPLYEAISCFLLFGVLWMIRKRFKPGMLFCIYLMMNGIERFFIEKIRVNSTYAILGHHITQAELISSALFLLGLVGILYFRKQDLKEADVN